VLRGWVSGRVGGLITSSWIELEEEEKEKRESCEMARVRDLYRFPTQASSGCDRSRESSVQTINFVSALPALLTARCVKCHRELL
jgi:hypothetical protein